MTEQPRLALGVAVREVIPDEERANDAALFVAHGRGADLEQLPVVTPNAVTRATSPEQAPEHGHLPEQRLAEHAVRVRVTRDDAPGLVDDGDDVRSLVAPSSRIAEPSRDALGGIECAAATVGLARRREHRPHRLARGALRHPLREQGAIGAP